MMTMWLVMAALSVVLIFVASDPRPPNTGGPSAKATV